MITDNILNLKSFYRSGHSDLGRDFFVPCLSSCTSYKRAVGYFSSSVLTAWAQVLPRIAELDTIRIQLLASPVLSDQDKDAIQNAVSPEKRDRLLQEYADQIVLDAIDFSKAPLNVALRLKLLTWLIANNKLELRFAFPEHIDTPGTFHEKIGVFEFPSDRIVAFSGSANESEYGYSRNYESIEVFRSWLPHDIERVRNKCEQFEDAWHGNALGLRMLPLSENALAQVKSRAPNQPPSPSEFAEAFELEHNRWRHQDIAVERFLEHERGVLEMATGTGKTRTALRIFKRLVEKDEIDTLIVATDGTDLLDQWFAQLLTTTQEIERGFSVIRHYYDYHDRERFQLNPKLKILLTSRLALPPALRSLKSADATRTLLIHDEVHALGSTQNRADLSKLSNDIRFRLGLSATPEREYDQVGTQFIEEHIGPVIFRFGLDEAIRQGILAPFYYYPLGYWPDENDRQRLQAIYRRQAARENTDNPMSKEELWTALAYVHKTSAAKLPIFRNFIDQSSNLLTRCIIFVETREYGEKVLEIVHRHRHDFHTYYSEDDSNTLKRFAKGDLECLITCHRLSEGIDIQNLTTVILFSSARSRLETIQRMGRCLRIDPTNPTKRANIIDFIRQSDDPQERNTDMKRQLWLAELAAIELASEAIYEY